jgi:hypothetical protein
MIFLVEYQRSAGKLVRLLRFDDADRERAERARLEVELRLLGNADYEVVLLEADSEATLRRTHRRYFEDLRTLAETGGS